MADLVLIKLGGAVLTDKKDPCSIRQDNIDSLAQCLAGFSGKMILGNGGGSFGHFFAEKYDLTHGLKDRNSVIGMSIGKAGNAYLNSKLVQSFIKYNMPAVSYPITSSFSDLGNNSDLLRQAVSYLDIGMTPVVYGDFLYDADQSCRIASTEKIFLSFINMINSNNDCKYKIKKIIFCTDRDGIEDMNGGIIRVIDRNKFNRWEIFWDSSDNYDVTGGMKEKVKMAFKVQCPVWIVNGNDPENLKHILNENNGTGTLIN